MISPFRIVPVLFGLLLCTGWANAQGQDVRGSKDHPLLSRYPGSVITQYDQKEYDELTLPLGPVKDAGFEKSQHLEGKYMRLVYRAPKERSILEVYRNYESALQRLAS